MRKNKHLLLWSSALALALLVTAAVQENFLREWRRLQQTMPADGDAPDVRLRQIVVPALGVTNRCVSCHVGMLVGESSAPGSVVTAPHPRVPHDPGEYGCTVCHGGQGRATDRAAAHGAVDFWPEPMLPLPFVYAGCGACHTHLQVPNLRALRAGVAAFERNDCFACHRLDGRGGTLRPDGGGMEGPDLSAIADPGVPSGWYGRHLAARDASELRAWSVGFGEVAPDDLAALDVLLRSRVGAPALVEGKAVFHSLGCRGCHKVNGVGGDDGPDLTRAGVLDPGRLDFSQVPGERTLANWLAEHFRAPHRVVAASRMPILGLTDAEIELLTLYVLSLRRTEFPEAFVPNDRMRARLGEREFSTDGATLWGTFCAACHGPAGEGMRYPGMVSFPAVASAGFLELASDDFIAETIRRGRPGRRMPAWAEPESGLRPAEIDALVAYLRAAGGVAHEPDGRARRWVTGDAAAGQRLFASICAGCHGPDGEGGEGPALANPVLLATATDTYLTETIRRGRPGTAMPSFTTPSPVRPVLTPDEIEDIVAFLRAREEAS